MAKESTRPLLLGGVAALAALLICLLLPGPRSPALEAAPRPAREQTHPTLAWNASKEGQRYLLVWVEDRGGGSDLYGKFLFANGLPQGGPSKGGWAVVRPDAFGRGGDPGARTDPSLVWHGGRQEFLLVYSEYTDEVDGWDVYGVRVSTAGYSRSKPRLLAGGPGDQQHPDVARSGDDYLVVWDDNARDLDEVWGLRVRANGIPNGSPRVLVQTETWNASDPTTSGSVVAWVDDRAGSTEIWAQRLRNGLPNGTPYRLAGSRDDDFHPRFSSAGMIWNTYDPASGVDIRGARVYQNDRSRGGAVAILVPAADQSWPDAERGLVVFSDNRSGEYDLYAVRTTGTLARRGREFPVLSDRLE